jgi:chitinase
MADHTLIITSAHDKQRIDLHGNMDVLLDTEVTDDFSVVLFTSTSEVFTIRSTLLQFIDANGTLATSFNFGGRPSLFVELMYNPTAKVWRIVTTNTVAGTAASGGSGGPVLDNTERQLTLTALPNLTKVDYAYARNFRVMMTKNVKIANPRNMNPGDRIRMVIIQDNIGSRTMAFDAAYAFIGALPPALSTNPYSQDILDIYKTSDGKLLCELTKNIDIVIPIAYVHEFAYTMGVAVTNAQTNPINGQTIQVIRDGHGSESNTTIGYQTANLDIRLRGANQVNGRWPMLRLERGQRAAFGKAIVNVEGGRTVVIENLEVSGGTSIDAGNGCGILINPGVQYVLLQNLHITDSENGIRTAVTRTPHIDIVDCLVEGNGYSTFSNEVGQTHNIYVGDCEIMRMERVTFSEAKDGHNLKSRARTMVLKQVFCNHSLGSRELDYCDQGVLHVYDSVFYKTNPSSQNSLAEIGKELADGARTPQEYYFYNCYFHNDAGMNGSGTFMENMTGSSVNSVAVHFIDCIFGGDLLNRVNFRETMFQGPYTITLTGGPTGPRVPVGDARLLWDPSNRAANVTTNPLNIALTPIENLPPPMDTEPRPPYPDVFAETAIVPALPDFTVSDGDAPPDTIAPVISLQADQTTVTVTGNLNLSATASDAGGLDRVEFYDNGVLIGTDSTSPYTLAVPITRSNNGSHRYTAKAYDTSANTATSAPVDVTVNIPVPRVQPTTTLDSATQNEYDYAANAAPTGSKRLAAAGAIQNAMKPQHRLYIYKNGTLVVPVEYSGDMVIQDDGYDVTISPSATIVSNDPLFASDISQGTWWFEVQGSPDFSRILSGTVGPVGSGADLELDNSPAPGQGFAANVVFVIPRSLDGLT